MKDDELHHATEPLAAGAIADKHSKILGTMINRVRYLNAPKAKFESGLGDLAALLKAWRAEVRRRGIERAWIPTPRTEWDATAREALFIQVADASLAYFLQPHCETCSGTGVLISRLQCKPCGGTGQAEIAVTGQLVKKLSLDMVSELRAIADSHNGRAAGLLRRRP